MGINRRNFLSLAAMGSASGLLLAGTNKSLGAEAQTKSATPAGQAYSAPAIEQDLSPAMLVDLEKEAEKALPPGPFAFIARGAEKQWTLRRNQAAFDRVQILPQYLGGYSPPDLNTTILGTKISLPVITTPMGAHGLAHKTGELGTAKGTAEAKTIMTVSTAANNSLEDIFKASNGPKWFQIYLLEDDRPGSRKILQQAEALGYSAIVFTIDAFAPGSSDPVERLGFSFPPNLAMPISGASVFKKSLSWDDVKFIQDSVDLPLILKGLVTPRLVERALKAGVQGLQVSNHGGRQLDGAPAALEALPAIAKEVNGDVPLIMDSGIRRGSDVFKALALGADVVALGRPVLYGLALGGYKGVAGVYERLRRELTRAMNIAGVSKVKDINSDMVELCN